MNQSQSWREQAITRIQLALSDPEANIADRCALYRELVRLSGGGVLRVSNQDFSAQDWKHHLKRHRLQAVPEAGRPWWLTDQAHSSPGSMPKDFWSALSVDPQTRRPWEPVPADALLLRHSSHQQYTCPTQKAALRALATMPPGQCLLVSMPTGSGKSVLFQAGIRFFRDHETRERPVAIVIAPTRALVQDHLKTLTLLTGLENSRQLNGDMSETERREVKEATLAGEVPILLASPEILLGWGREFLKRLAQPTGERYSHEKGRLWAVFVDEAHIIESWGRGFRPDFQRLPGLISDLRNPTANQDLRVILLSATLPPSSRNLLRQQYGQPDRVPLEIHAGVPRTEFDLVFKGFNTEREREEAIREIIPVLPRPAILYTTLVEDAKSYYNMLREDFSYRRVALVTGEAEEPWSRQEIIRKWSANEIDLVVATSAFGMGIDKPDVRTVVHACVPESPSRLYQEMGRAGRDGHQAIEVCLYYEKDAESPRSERDDFDQARGLATNEFLTVDRAIERWHGLVADARHRENAIRLTSHGQELDLRLDATPADMNLQRTGQLNRGWNAVLINLLQRQKALEVWATNPEQESSEWTVRIQQTAILSDRPEDQQTLRNLLGAREDELDQQRKGVRMLKALLHNRTGDCLLLSLVREVEEREVWGNCGRCTWCRQNNLPASSHWRFGGTRERWSKLPNVAGPEFAGRVVISPIDPYFVNGFADMASRLTRYGIQEHLVPDAWAVGIATQLAELRSAYGLVLTHREFEEHDWLPIGWPLAIWVDPQKPRDDSFWAHLEMAIDSARAESVIVVGTPNLVPWPWRTMVYQQHGVGTA